MRDLNRLGHLRLAEFLYPEIAQRIHHPAGRHQLDPVGAVLDIAPGRGRNLIHRVGDVRAPWQFLIDGELIGVAMAAGKRQTLTGDDHAWSLNEALLDAVAQCNLSVVAVGLASIPQSRESLVEPDAQVAYTPQRCLGRRHAEASNRR